MYKINDYVMYGTTGVCKVQDICTKEIGGEERLYYALKPEYDDRGLTIFISADNQNSSIRNVISKEDALKLIEDMPGMDDIWFDNYRERENAYKDILKSGECDKIAQMLKGLYANKNEVKKNGKKVLSADKASFQCAERLINEELGTALGMNSKEVKDYIGSVLKEK